MSLREYLQKFVNVLPLSTELLIANITAVIFVADILLVHSCTLLALKTIYDIVSIWFGSSEFYHEMCGLGLAASGSNVIDCNIA